MYVRLNLTIRGKWFEMIARGEKLEEYRDCENKQAQRAYLDAFNDVNFFHHHPVAILRNGYTMQSRALVVKVVGFDLRGRRDVRHREWGEPRCRRSHIVVKLGAVLKRGTYREAKDWLATETKQKNNKETK